MARLTLMGVLAALSSRWTGIACVKAKGVTKGLVGRAAQSLPPIECPLQKAGIDPTKLKPLEDVEKYIQFHSFFVCAACMPAEHRHVRPG